tara:strand:- start:544 stop:744 length:201 start_codon:yes stop_codon:yes gene_type:complete
MKEYMAKCEAKRKQKAQEHNKMLIAEGYGYCLGTKYSEWKQPTRQKRVPRKGKTHSHTTIWNYKYQ